MTEEIVIPLNNLDHSQEYPEILDLISREFRDDPTTSHLHFILINDFNDFKQRSILPWKLKFNFSLQVKENDTAFMYEDITNNPDNWLFYQSMKHAKNNQICVNIKTRMLRQRILYTVVLVWRIGTSCSESCSLVARHLKRGYDQDPPAGKLLFWLSAFVFLSVISMPIWVPFLPRPEHHPSC
jgi:hypothetical protein